MRKNKVVRKNLKKLFYSTFEIRGLNLDRFINTLGKRGVLLMNVKKFGNKRLRVSVNSADDEKFFAIAEELCYNVKKLGDGGRFYPLLYLYRNIGLFLGAAVFIAAIFFFNDLIFSFSFTGSGRIYGREVREFLSGMGINEYSRFSDIDLKGLGESILADNSHLSFVDCRKVGNRLEIDMALSTDSVKRLEGNVKELRADSDGVVERVKVYRGTAEVTEGQSVVKGDILVGGYAMVGEVRVEMNVIAQVSVVSGFTYEYRSNKDNEGDIALLYAEAAAGDKEIINSRVQVKKEGEEYVYTAELSYRRVYFVG